MDVDEGAHPQAQTARNPARERLIAAALTVYGEVRDGRRRFADVCELAGVPRATGYRHFPSGTESLLKAIHRRTVVDVIRSIRRETDPLRSQQVTFEVAAGAAIRGAIGGLSETPYTVSVLSSHRNFATAFLLSRGPGTIFDSLAMFTVRCAATFGSEVGLERCERLIWEALSEFLLHLSTDASRGGWPDLDDEVFVDVLMRGPLSKFIKDAGLGGVHRAGLVLPELPVPEESSSALESVLVP